ncbi:MAG: sn-glycerol-3-phosphate import ATP-binding protein UgpC [Ectothiorhodospiraceae bacterium]|nr:sn-glycerol-3-phosphate import ATP-binding protein UgpC [Ectothiorhodospiraceae bacterium]
MAEISIRGVTKRFGDTAVIHGVDLEIADGELIVVVGPSGCGKSTLLRMVAGLERISGGEIAIGGRVVNDLEPMHRDIAMVFQNYALYPHMSVFDNMAYGLRNRRVPGDEIARRVARAAEILHLEPFLRRRPRELSGGQRQRVAMGRAIVREPAVFLFDEPLSNLDAKLRVQMRLEIKKLQRDLAITSIYVTHDQVEAMTLADRLVVMNAGRAEQVGTPLEVYRDPASAFVAGFIGSPAMNFVPGTASPDGRAVVVPGGQSLALPGVMPGGAPLTVGIRPEHLETDEAPGRDPVDLTIDLVEPLGADTLVHGALDGAELTARLPGGAVHTAGERLRLWIEPERIHLFDPADGSRLRPGAG